MPFIWWVNFVMLVVIIITISMNNIINTSNSILIELLIVFWTSAALHINNLLYSIWFSVVFFIFIFFIININDVIFTADVYFRIRKHNLFTLPTFTLHYWRKRTWKWGKQVCCFFLFCYCSYCRVDLCSCVFYFLFIVAYSTMSLFRSQWWSTFIVRRPNITLKC